MIKVLPPKTAEEAVARERERKARTTLLMALPKDHLAKFYKMADAKEMWEAIKSRFGGNDESKKMQKYLLKQQFEGFSVSTSKDANQKFLRSLPSSCSQVALIMRTKPGLDTLSFDNLYNNLRVFERDVKGSSSYTDEDIHSRDCRAKGNQDSKRKDVWYNGNKARDNGRRPAYHDDSKALVTIDGDDIDWSRNVEEDAQNYDMMAYSSSNSGSNNQVKSCSKTCEESYARLKKLYEEQRDKLGDASVEITSYTLALKKESDLENTSVNDRYAKGMHAVPPPMTGNYMPSGPDVEIDYSKFTYGLKQTSADESDSKPSEYASCESDSSVETTTSMLEPIKSAPKVVCEPKVWTDAPIIEEYESDSDDDSDDPHRALKDKGIVDSGCSMHITGNKAHLVDYQEFKGGSVSFGGSNGRITSKGKIKAGKKNKVLFTVTNCLMLSPDFKLPDENQVLLKIPRQHNMYSFNLKNIDPSGGLACLFAKASIDESNKWHRRLGHVNFKNLNKLVKENLVRGLPSKIFENDHTCVAFQKGKQHKASCKAKTVSSVNQPLQILHMDLFGPTSVKTIRSDNGTEFKNNDLIEFCGLKGIKREYSNARSPQQNRVAERKNRTLIEAARTMLVDLFLPTTFWAEAVNTTCYVLNRVLVTKPQNKTPYELLTGKQPILSYLRSFGYHVTILNTIDQLGKFDEKSDLGFLVGYSLNSKAFRVYNLETKRVEENLHVTFLENKHNVAGKGHAWMFV
uniref:Integrase catalytic domain-containing protein n=1 Tax=Tanacetum cinerariifolium TaxID=118510 RepID=A0A6L2MDQ4_TANCI|nr:hypothetical protein [Tanacetum cinerariifolium]